MIHYLNTSYVEVKLLYVLKIVEILVNLNTSYVEVKQNNKNKKN